MPTKREEGGKEGRGKASLPIQLSLTTIGCATADVTSHQGRGTNVTQAGFHLFLITWEVSLAHLPPFFLLPFPPLFLFYHLHEPGQAPSPSLATSPSSTLHQFPSPSPFLFPSPATSGLPAKKGPELEACSHAGLQPLIFSLGLGLPFPPPPIPMPLFALVTQL